VPFLPELEHKQGELDEAHSLQASPEKVVELAVKHKVPSIAFTYNDPVIWGEFVIDISRLAQSQGLKSVMVTAGYITPEARPEVFSLYRRRQRRSQSIHRALLSQAYVSHLDPVLDTLKWLKEETDIWFEITNLIIPDENDNPDETKKLCDWVVENLGDRSSTSLHRVSPGLQTDR